MQLILRIGHFVTGTNLEEEDVVSATTKQLGDGRDYYLYEVTRAAMQVDYGGRWLRAGSSTRWRRLRGWGMVTASTCARCTCQWELAGRLGQQQGSPGHAVASPKLGSRSALQ